VAAEAALRPTAHTAHVTGRQGQPPTAAIDSLDCPVLLLPAHVQLRAKAAGALQREGYWQDPGGATLVTWTQEFLRLSPEKLYYSRNAELLFETEPTDRWQEQQGDVTVLRDCVGVPMYSFRIRRGERYAYDVFDRDGALIARSIYNGSTYFPKQLVFLDKAGDPLAIAEAPEIMRPTTLGRTWSHEDRNLEDAMTVWEVMFYDARHSKSALVQAQHRWVIASIVQNCALIDAAADGSIGSGSAVVQACAWIIASLVPLTIAMVLLEACRHNYRLVHPPSADKVSNMFLSSTYGAVAVPRPRIGSD